MRINRFSARFHGTVGGGRGIQPPEPKASVRAMAQTVEPLRSTSLSDLPHSDQFWPRFDSPMIAALTAACALSTGGKPSTT